VVVVGAAPAHPVHGLVFAALVGFATQPTFLAYGLGWFGLCGHRTALALQPDWLGLVWPTGLHGFTRTYKCMQSTDSALCFVLCSALPEESVTCGICKCKCMDQLYTEKDYFLPHASAHML